MLTEIILNNKNIVLLIVISLVSLACSFDKKEEYFCEQRTDNSTMKDGSHIFYQQSSLVITDKEFCHNYSSQTSCAPFEQIVKGSDEFDKQEAYEENYTELSFYKSSRISDNIFKLEQFKKYVPNENSKVSKKLINNLWHFYYDGKEMHYTLPIKDASNESIAVFELYTADDAIYCYLRESCYGMETYEEMSDRLDKQFGIVSDSKKEKKKLSEFGELKKLPLVVGNKKYNYFLSYVQGNYLEHTYVFDRKKSLLTIIPRNPIDDKETYVSCSLWSKQKWYEFP